MGVGVDVVGSVGVVVSSGLLFLEPSMGVVLWNESASRCLFLLGLDAMTSSFFQ